MVASLLSVARIFETNSLVDRPIVLLSNLREVAEE
jgi:hypothetical protein